MPLSLIHVQNCDMLNLPTMRLYAALTCVVLAFALSVLAPIAVHAQTLQIGGTGGGLATLRQLGDAFVAETPGMSVTVLPSLGSNGGLRAVGDGAIDIAVSARPLNAAERATGALVEIPFARTAVALVTSHPVGFDLPPDAAARLFSDPAATWPDGAPVRAIARQLKESDYEAIRPVFPVLYEGFAAAWERPDTPRADTDQLNLELAASLDGSLTVATALQVQAEAVPLTLLPIDGAAPTAANLASGAYPVGKDFFLVVQAGATGPAQDFIGFVRSDEGAALLRGLEALPLE